MATQYTPGALKEAMREEASAAVDDIHGKSTCNIIPYSQKYWWELKLAVGPQIAIAKILADLNLAVW